MIGRQASLIALLAGGVLTAFFGGSAPAEEPNAAPDANATKPVERGDTPSSVDEARGRARLLHETLHGTLQYVHREYFREDEGLKIPAVALKSVFRDVEAARRVKLRWLAVNARPMSVDHEPADAFEKEAAKQLADGKDFHESVEDGTYRYVGSIALHAECLKCHLPARSNNKTRAAGLAISIPLGKPGTALKPEGP